MLSDAILVQQSVPPEWDNAAQAEAPTPPATPTEDESAPVLDEPENLQSTDPATTSALQEPEAIVFYVMDSDRSAGQERPAFIVRSWGPEVKNLQVFTDGHNDGQASAYGILWRTSVPRDESPDPAFNTWHFPARAN